jgi:LPXTG-site transpeptidase (sortase) family protein
VSSIARSPVEGTGGIQRFAAGFGRVSAVLSAVALLVAVGLSVPSSWFSLGGHDRDAAPAYAELAPAEPVRLAVAGADLVAPLVASDLDPRDTLAQPPTDAPLVTWWSGSAQPGATHGQTVLTGHATGAGGALTAISKLDKGDFLDVLTKKGTMGYQVSTVRTYDPAAMDRAGIMLFKQDGGAGRLVLVSAEAWDGHRYPRSVVVTAAPLGQPRS